MNNIEIIEYIEYISVRPKMYLIKYDYEELINHISYFISRSVWEKIIEIENPNNPMEIFFNEIENFKKEVMLNL